MFVVATNPLIDLIAILDVIPMSDANIRGMSRRQRSDLIDPCIARVGKCAYNAGNFPDIHATGQAWTTPRWPGPKDNAGMSEHSQALFK